MHSTYVKHQKDERKSYTNGFHTLGKYKVLYNWLTRFLHEIIGFPGIKIENCIVRDDIIWEDIKAMIANPGVFYNEDRLKSCEA